MLMQNLIDDPGCFRVTNVGIFKGSQVAHVAPKAARIKTLMDDLFVFLKRTKDLSWLLKSCIFHYEFEFIHPFVDGNGRIGRLWQQLLLMQKHHVFAFIPVEAMVRKNQACYYKTLRKCDQIGESTAFIEFLLEIILEAIIRYGKDTEVSPNDPAARLKYALTYLTNRWFGRKDYLAVHSNLSPATASRDLIYGVKHNLLASAGKCNQVKYRFV